MLCSAILSAPKLVSAATLPAGVSFLGGWDQGLILGPGAWDSSQWMAPNRFQLVTDRVRKDPYAIRVEVDPGDDPINSGSERGDSFDAVVATEFPAVTPPNLTKHMYLPMIRSSKG